MQEILSLAQQAANQTHERYMQQAAGMKKSDAVNSMIVSALGIYTRITFGSLWFAGLDDYKLWAKDRSPYCNSFAYLKMVEERNHATRLEF
jgi:hypothetical protein